MWYFVVTLFLTTPSTDGGSVLVKFRTLAECQEAQQLVVYQKASPQQYSITVSACQYGLFYGQARSR